MVEELSVGLQQRVEILKALYRERRHPDPRRADRRADAGRGRPPVPHPPRAARRRARPSSSSPTSCARSWRSPTTCRSCAQGEMVGDRCTTAETTPGRARRADGRPPGAAARREGARHARARWCSRSRTSRVVDDKGVERLDGMSASRCAPARSSASPASPATASRELLEVLAGMRDRRPAARAARTAQPLDARRATTPTREPRAARASPTCPRTASAMGLVMAFAAWENVVPRLPGRGALRPTASCSTAPAIARHAPAKIERFDIRPPNLRPQDRQLLRRQPAEDRARARDRARPRACCSSASRRAASTSAPSSSSTSRSSRCATRGKAILLVSVELDEIRALSDRILVMFDGRIIGRAPGRPRPTSASSAC